MAKDAPPMLVIGREPCSTGLNFDDILTSMGITDDILNENSDSSEENKQANKGASII